MYSLLFLLTSLGRRYRARLYFTPPSLLSIHRARHFPRADHFPIDGILTLSRLHSPCTSEVSLPIYYILVYLLIDVL
jgi:hypothetical protein